MGMPKINQACPTCGHIRREYAGKRDMTPKEPVWVSVNGQVTEVREKAVRFVGKHKSGVPADLWIPRSQIRSGEHAQVGVTLLMVNQWFADKEALKQGE